MLCGRNEECSSETRNENTSAPVIIAEEMVVCSGGKVKQVALHDTR